MQIVVTGHSLGAALATLYVAENSVIHKATIPLICTFASPRVGDYAFASKFDQLGIPSWRIRNEPDLIPMLPPPLLFWHVQTEYMYNSLLSVVWSPECWHYLETYLHLLDSAQPLKKECVLSTTTAATAKLAPAVALSPATQNEIALSVPNEAGAKINITIKIG
jgi:lipase (class 3)